MFFAALAFELALTGLVVFSFFGGDVMRQDVLSPQARREVRRDTALRRARTCYGHLAGVAGVDLLEELLRLGWLGVAAAADSRRVGYAPTVAGAAALGQRGVVVPAGRGGMVAAFSCLDWTERRPHLGGALGRAIVAALVDAGCVVRNPGSRVVTVNGGGLGGWLDP